LFLSLIKNPARYFHPNAHLDFLVFLGAEELRWFLDDWEAPNTNKPIHIHPTPFHPADNEGKNQCKPRVERLA